MRARQTKPLPDQWEYVAGTEHHGPYVIDHAGRTICDCYVMSPDPVTNTPRPYWFNEDEAVPNARLIAAAPELLEALRDMLSMLRAAHYKLGVQADSSKRVLKAVAAIKKAEGPSE